MLRLLHRVVAVEPGERRGLLLATAWFFCLLASYYLLRPVRDALGVERGETALKWLFLATFLATLVVVPAYAWLAGRLPRQRLLRRVYHTASAACVGFAAVLWWLPPGSDARVAVGYVFFVAVSVYNLLGLSALFWGFLADLYRPEQGKRLFGFIAAGGTLGSVAGSGLAGVVALWGVEAVLLAAAAGIQASVWCMRALARAHHADDGGIASGRASATFADAWRGARQIAGSPYLAGIAALTLFDVFASTFLYATQGAMARALLADQAARTQFFARIDLGVNVLALVFEVFVAARAMRRLGLAVVLGALPLASLSALTALAAAPSLFVLWCAQVVHRGVKFGIAKPAREVLFTAVARHEKYEAKAFLDTAVNRGADTAVLWLLAAVPRATPGAALWVAVPGAAAWILTSVLVARGFRRRTGSGPAT